ncbi:hypothetical protein GCM10012287_41150 [Streptomyces daqingensis]|uniref:Uncharacterized protein n=1 Tax=Streptomyces daqingensis TaxID=1472640 RepID=A0ABQ2ML79_9ACTN|nr:hypothetical protein [Streptomyces daqingensis]GGO53753.1 hypothetical protein GCM10012287_41150 [Streptomyces daqingensis]
MPADVAGRAAGDGDAGRLRMDDRLLAVAGRVVAGMELPQELVEVRQVAGLDVGVEVARPAA